MTKINSWRQKGKGKGGAVSTKFDRELKNWTVGGRRMELLGKGLGRLIVVFNEAQNFVVER